MSYDAKLFVAILFGAYVIPMSIVWLVLRFRKRHR
jgi:hypothetical protein